MRRNFAQVLKEGKVDLKKEYSKLYDLFYGKDPRDGKSLADLISLNFEGFYFRGTCLDLGEFDEVHEFRFEEQPKIFDIDYLVSFCEYIYNFVLHFEDHYFFGQINKSFYLQQINKVIETIGYIQCSEDGFTIFVPKDNAAIAVSESELIPEALSYKIIAYNHHSMKGNLESKRQTLLMFADLLEPKRDELETVDELVHLIKRSSAVCNEMMSSFSAQKEEVFCNAVAGEVLVPKANLLKQLGSYTADEIDLDMVETIAAKFSVSKEVVCRRLLDTKKISQAHYSSLMATIRTAFENEREQMREYRRITGKTIPRNISREAIDQNSSSLCKTFYHGFREGYFDKQDVARYLGVKQNHIDKFMWEVSKW